METNREKIVKEIDFLRNEIKEKREILDKIDYDNKFNKAKEFVGKCFIQEEEADNSNYIRCYFIYGVTENNCTSKTLEVSYFNDCDSHFEISDTQSFYPNEKEDSFYVYKEITKEEFDLHYNKVKELIENSLTSKI